MAYGRVLPKYRQPAELELIQTEMTQKQMLRAEGDCACEAQMARSKIRGRGGGKCLAMKKALVGGVNSGNAHRKAPDLRNTEFHYSRGQKRLFSAQGA